jgi:PBP1b-binding outer membrane lipoprotein LpoB
MKKDKIKLIFVLLIALTLFGCSDNVFSTEYEKFKDSYMLSTSFIEEDNDTLKVLEKMDIEKVESELKNMKTAMEKMAGSINTKIEEGIYGNVENYYEDIEFLVYASKNIEKLTIEEKKKVFAAEISISTTRYSIIEGEQ